jgi:hypothetical protein
MQALVSTTARVSYTSPRASFSKPRGAVVARAADRPDAKNSGEKTAKNAKLNADAATHASNAAEVCQSDFGDYSCGLAGACTLEHAAAPRWVPRARSAATRAHVILVQSEYRIPQYYMLCD